MNIGADECCGPKVSMQVQFWTSAMISFVLPRRFDTPSRVERFLLQFG